MQSFKALTSSVSGTSLLSVLMEDGVYIRGGAHDLLHWMNKQVGSLCEKQLSQHILPSWLTSTTLIQICMCLTHCIT